MPPKLVINQNQAGGVDANMRLGKEYIDSLSELEQRVCEIARDHLKSSFDLERSSGFISWKNSHHDKK
jgi:hypothetical protein